MKDYIWITDAFAHLCTGESDNPRCSIEAANTLQSLLKRPVRPAAEPPAADEDPTVVSVVIPTHNRVDMLQRAVGSVLMQTHRHVQVIIVDDASTDETERVIPPLYAGDSRVEYYRNARSLGPGGARHEGYRHVRGEFVVYLDDDDYYIEPRFFQMAVAALHQNESCVAVMAESVLHYVHGERMGVAPLTKYGLVACRECFLGFGSVHRKPNSTFTALFRVSMLNKAGFADMQVMNDASIYLRALCFGDAYYLPDVIGVYVIHNANISNKMPHGFLMQNLEEKRSIYEHARSAFSEPLDNWFKTQILSTVRYYFMGTAVSKAQRREVTRWCRAYVPNCAAELRKLNFRAWLQHIKRQPLAGKLRKIRNAIRDKSTTHAK